MNNKDKEALKNEVKQTSHGISVTKYNKELVRREFEKLQAENAKLRECVEFYANTTGWDNGKKSGEASYTRARQVLKKLEIAVEALKFYGEINNSLTVHEDHEDPEDFLLLSYIHDRQTRKNSTSSD